MPDPTQVASRARLIEAIARELGGRVTRNVTMDHDWYAEVAAAGMAISLHFNSNYGRSPDRLEFSPVSPEYSDERGHKQRVQLRDVLPYDQRGLTTTFTVAASRGAAAIARDIERRAIVGLKGVFEKAVARAHEHEEGAKARVRTERDLATQLGCECRNGTFYCEGVTMRVDSADSVRIEYVYVRPAVALQIARLVHADKARA